MGRLYLRRRGGLVHVASRLVVTALRNRGYLKPVTIEHYHIMGKWMLVFTIFWAYIGFSQYMLIWYANIPEETIYFRIRNTESWHFFSTFLVVGRFFIPFPILLTQWIKKHPNRLCLVAGWVLLMQLLDMYVVVLPSLHNTGFQPEHSSISPALIGIGGLVAWLWFRILGSASALPHARSASRGLSQTDELTWCAILPPRRLRAFFTFLGGLLLLAIFAFGILFWVRSAPAPADNLKLRRAQGRSEARTKLDEQYAAQLGTAGWVDKKKGIAHVPIEEAMTMTVAELKAKKVAASTVKLDAPLPPVTVDPKSTEPPPVAMPSAPQGAITSASIRRKPPASLPLRAPAGAARCSGACRQRRRPDRNHSHACFRAPAGAAPKCSCARAGPVRSRTGCSRSSRPAPAATVRSHRPGSGTGRTGGGCSGPARACPCRADACPRAHVACTSARHSGSRTRSACCYSRQSPSPLRHAGHSAAALRRLHRCPRRRPRRLYRPQLPLSLLRPHPRRLPQRRLLPPLRPPPLPPRLPRLPPRPQPRPPPTEPDPAFRNDHHLRSTFAGYRRSEPRLRRRRWSDWPSSSNVRRSIARPAARS